MLSWVFFIVKILSYDLCNVMITMRIDSYYNFIALSNHLLCV